MAMPIVSGSTGIRPLLCSVEAASPSTQSRGCCLPLQRAQVGKNRWRVACAGVGQAGEWRRQSGELRAEMHELEAALADAWMQEEMNLIELEKLVSSLVAMTNPRAPYQASEARDGEVWVPTSTSARNEAATDANAELQGADELYKNTMITSELRSEELRSKQEGLSTLRRLKTLNVHEYVHSALRASHLRSWLKSRGIAE